MENVNREHDKEERQYIVLSSLQLELQTIGKQAGRKEKEHNRMVPLRIHPQWKEQGQDHKRHQRDQGHDEIRHPVIDHGQRGEECTGQRRVKLGDIAGIGCP